jgi:hypothetical protein
VAILGIAQAGQVPRLRLEVPLRPTGAQVDLPGRFGEAYRHEPTRRLSSLVEALW